jgi:hypothetical protein
MEEPEVIRFSYLDSPSNISGVTDEAERQKEDDIVRSEAGLECNVL